MNNVKWGRRLKSTNIYLYSPVVESQIHIIQWFDLLNKYYLKKNRYTFDLIIALKVPPKAFVYELQIMALLQIIRYNKSTENILKAEAEWAP